MPEAIPATNVESIPPISMPVPQEIYNCPQCSHYVAPGMLACPDCKAMVYGVYLQNMGQFAQTLEEQQRWPEARAAWTTMLIYLPAATQQAEAVRERIGAIDARFSKKAARKAAWTKRLGPLAPLLVLLAKLKTALFFLLKMKFLLSFVAFFGLYWALFGWKFGLGFTVGILIHEMGHYVAAKRRGLNVDLPVFIPGMGAYVRWYSQGTSLEDLSTIALAGPFFGLLAAGVFAALSIWLKSPLFSALTHVTAWLNLLNLIPLFWLDGAQATLALNRMQRWMLVATSVIFFVATQEREWVFVFIGGGMAFRAFQSDAPETDRSKTLLSYILLLFLLGTLIWVFPDSGRRF